MLVGSWPNKLSVKPKDGEKFGVDFGVVMPEVSIEFLRRVYGSYEGGFMYLLGFVPGEGLFKWTSPA